MENFAEIQPHFIFFLRILGFFSLFGTWVYFSIVAPALCKFWLIPRIEKRYQQKVIFDKKGYPDGPLLPLPWIGTGVIEIAFCYTIVCMYFGWKWPLKPQKDKQYNGLCKINYDVRTATTGELIVAFTTALCPFVMLIGPCLVIYLLRHLGA